MRISGRARGAVVSLCLVVGIGIAVGRLPKAEGSLATAASLRAAAAGSQLFLPIVYQTYQLPFFDDFSNPTSGWPVMQTSVGSWGYVNGQYRMQTLTANYVLYADNNLDASDFQAEVSATTDTPTSATYGLYFGYNGALGRYIFDVSPEFGQFVLYRRDYTQNPSTTVVIAGPISSSSILSGSQTNLLKVTRSRSTITLFINGQQVDQVSDSTLGTGTVGMEMYGAAVNAESFFDNFAFVGNTTTPLPSISRSSVSVGRSPHSIGEAGSDPMNPTVGSH